MEEYRAAVVGLHDRLRRTVPGNLDRDDRWWDRLLRDDDYSRKGAAPRAYLLHTEPDGTVTGDAAYQVKGDWTEHGEPDGTITVEEVRAATPPAYAALWQVLLSVDLVRTLRAPLASPDDPLVHLLTDARALHRTPVRRALGPTGRRRPRAGRAALPGADRPRARGARRVLPVERRPVAPHRAPRRRPTAARTDRDPDLVLGIEELSAVYLGGVSLATLQAAGRVTEISPGAVTLAATAFRWPVTPWCPDEF